MTWIDLATPIIKEFEGLAKKLPDGTIKAYPDPASGGDPWTIGYGSTGPGIAKGTVWTLEQCIDRLKRDVGVFGNGVEGMLGGHKTSDNQLAAMVVLAYNIGLANFRKSSVLRNHIAEQWEAAALSFGLWNKAKINGVMTPMKGLTRRRMAEAALYRGQA
jgi:GH24 family phage-related lysozyme (muramidase)